MGRTGSVADSDALGCPHRSVLPFGGSAHPPMKRALIIIGLVLASIVTGLWLRVLVGNHRHFVEIPPSGNHRDYIEGRKKTRFHLLMLSDSRGVVFDVFIRQLPPEKAPGPPSSEETQRWSKPRAQRTAAAYGRFFGFEKGIQYRHGQYLNDPLYFYGVDYYFAVPHLLLIILGGLPALYLLPGYLRDRAGCPTGDEPTKHGAEPGASPNGGPATPFHNSGAIEGPPSVS
jgi:hypothetical protein